MFTGIPKLSHALLNFLKVVEQVVSLSFLDNVQDQHKTVF